MDVRTMTPDDEASAIATVVLAFVADPVTRWVWPHPRLYFRESFRWLHFLGTMPLSKRSVGMVILYVIIALVVWIIIAGVFLKVLAYHF